MSKLVGSHTFKVGADYRNIGVETQSFAGGAGRFAFTRLFTSSNPLTTNATSGNARRQHAARLPGGATSIQPAR